MIDNNSIKEVLSTALLDKSATIGVIGLGYVGLPLAIRFAQVGYPVIGFDIDDSKINKINSHETYIKHIPADSIRAASEAGFSVTTEFSRISECEAIIICVPTPLSEHKEPDLGYVVGTLDSILPYLKKGQIVSLESTTYPGTTEEVMKPRLEAAGYSIGENLFLVYSPEREDPGNEQYTTADIPKVCGGVTSDCLELGKILYTNVVTEVVAVSSTQAAEMTKLLENIHRAVNIGLVNEMKIVADRMGIDIHEVINAASTKPFGFVPYFPGPGLGGHCIPIDPFYLTWKAREYGVNTRFIELAGEVNSYMPHWVVSKVTEGLNNNRKSINGSRILVLGIAYKKNVDDMRESPSVVIMDSLVRLGALVDYSDPHVPVFPDIRRYNFDSTSVPLSADKLDEYDCVIIATDHDDFDYELIESSSSLVVDCRGRLRSGSAHVIMA